MSKLTLTQLVSHMQGKSLTGGWDALTLYDQRKANELLFQLYVDRFNSEDGYIKPASMVAQWGDGSYKEHIYELKLSAPRLSFESSDPSRPARARLTMDMVGGMIVSTRKFPGGAVFVSKMLKVLPLGGPQLWMEQPVTKGQVSGVGNVEIDIKNADTFKANFVFGDLAQDDVGKRFKEYFEQEVKPEQKVFLLGQLTGDLNGVLTPKNFEIRTMKSDPNALFGDENYGDGAVMMFITLKDGTDGTSFPNANSTYLIPADGGGSKYTGAMLLSSRVLFDKIMRGPAEADIGNGIAFLDYTPENGGGQDVAWALRGSAGGIEKKYKYDYKVRSDDFDATFETTLHSRFQIDEGGPALTIKGGATHVEFVWSKKYTLPFSRVIYWSFPTGPETDVGNLTFDCHYSVKFDVVVSKETGEVTFNRNVNSSVYNLNMTGYDYLPDIGDVTTYLVPQIKDYFRPIVYEILKELSPPAIDTFLLRNLLFPGHNALQLSDAFVTGDLAVFGQIDPLRTTSVLSPLNTTLEAGRTLQFTLTPMPDNVQWSVKDVDGKLAEPGVISASGMYTAPAADKLSDGFVAAMVTARGTLNGQAVESSALVSVLHSSITVNPIYDSCDPGDTKLLAAQALNGEVLDWKILTPQWGSTLTSVAGEPNHRTYKAGGSNDPDVPFSVDKIEIKRTVGGVSTYAYIHVLIHNQAIGTPMLISEASDPSTGTVQFEIRGKNGPIDPGLVTWKLLSGEGTFNERTGVYNQPASPPPGSFIVVSATLPGDFQDVHAVAAVPLPLSKYSELIETVNLTLAAG